MTIKQLNPRDIDTTAGTQARVSIMPSLVKEYAEAMKGGDYPAFPSIVAFAEDGSERYILADGFHTRMAFMDAFSDKDKTMNVDVREGTIFDAKVYAAGANAAHGNRRRPIDIQNAIKMLLLDGHTDGKANTIVADYAKCHAQTVAKVREALIISGDLLEQGTRQHEQDGKTVDVPVKPKASGTSKKTKKDKEDDKPTAAPNRTQDEYDREDIIGAIATLKSVVCSGADALERYNLGDHIEDAMLAETFLDELISSVDEDGAEIGDDEAFLKAG